MTEEVKPQKTVAKRKRKPPQKTVAKTVDGLTFEQEEFCHAYVSPEKEIFGNGTECYLLIYGPIHEARYKKKMDRRVAAACASRLLTNVKIIDKINGMLDSAGFNDHNVDKQHLFLLNQYGDLRAKLGAVKEYNSLKKRVDRPEVSNQFNFFLLDATEIQRRIGEVTARIARLGAGADIPEGQR